MGCFSFHKIVILRCFFTNFKLSEMDMKIRESYIINKYFLKKLIVHNLYPHF